MNRAGCCSCYDNLSFHPFIDFFILPPFFLLSFWISIIDIFVGITAAEENGEKKRGEVILVIVDKEECADYYFQNKSRNDNKKNDTTRLFSSNYVPEAKCYCCCICQQF